MTLSPTIPRDVASLRRWIAWALRSHKKPPIDAEGRAQAGWTDPSVWLTLDEARARVDALRTQADEIGSTIGVGFVLGDGWSGVDLDHCRDKETGAVDPRAMAVLDLCAGAYAEVSPSGEGLKVFGRGAHQVELKFNEHDVDVSRRDTGYFTVTGRGVEGHDDGAGWSIDLPLEAIAAVFAPRGADGKPLPAAKGMPEVVRPGAQNTELFREACRMRQQGKTEDEICGMLRVLADTRCAPAPGERPWTEADLRAIARSAARYDADGLTRNKDGTPFASADNVRAALRALDARPRKDAFSLRLMLERGGDRRELDDDATRRLWFELDERFRLRVPRGLFGEVVYDEAAQNPCHPVLEYLDSLRWDGTSRVATWLHAYGGAEDSEYVRAVGQLFLVAAVRRVRRPGCKFDELMVLESAQGTDKSNAVRALVPDPTWTSESLPLAADTKSTIERTTGVWIAEAAEMVGQRSDVDRLKAFLSVSADGPVRLAYAREPVIRPRQFVVVGTTNRSTYLRDSTGARRFWPVAVSRFDVEAIRRDRDQLWAEASALEAGGAPTRMDSRLWAAAGEEQESRRVADPWEELISERLGADEGRVLSSHLWDVVAVTPDRRSQDDNARLGAIMQRLGFRRQTIRDAGGEVRRGYTRGTSKRWLMDPTTSAGGQVEL